MTTNTTTSPIYSDWNEATYHIVTEVLEEYAQDYDIEAIAKEVIVPYAEFDNRGFQLLDRTGYVKRDMSEDDFWEVVTENMR